MTDAIIEHTLVEIRFEGRSFNNADVKNIFVGEGCMTNPYVRNGIIHEYKLFDLYTNLEKGNLIQHMVKEEKNCVWSKYCKRPGATAAATKLRSTLLEKRARALKNALRLS